MSVDAPVVVLIVLSVLLFMCWSGLKVRKVQPNARRSRMSRDGMQSYTSPETYGTFKTTDGMQSYTSPETYGTFKTTDGFDQGPGIVPISERTKRTDLPNLRWDGFAQYPNFEQYTRKDEKAYFPDLKWAPNKSLHDVERNAVRVRDENAEAQMNNVDARWNVDGMYGTRDLETPSDMSHLSGKDYDYQNRSGLILPNEIITPNKMPQLQPGQQSLAGEILAKADLTPEYAVAWGSVSI